MLRTVARPHAAGFNTNSTCSVQATLAAFADKDSYYTKVR